MVDITTLTDDELSTITQSFPANISDEDILFAIENAGREELLGGKPVPRVDTDVGVGGEQDKLGAQDTSSSLWAKPTTIPVRDPKYSTWDTETYPEGKVFQKAHEEYFGVYPNDARGTSRDKIESQLGQDLQGFAERVYADPYFAPKKPDVEWAGDDPTRLSLLDPEGKIDFDTFIGARSGMEPREISDFWAQYTPERIEELGKEDEDKGIVGGALDTAKSVVGHVAGVPETMTSMATGFFSSGVGGVVGLGSALFNWDAEKFPEEMERIQAGFTYQPRTEAGQKYMENIGEFYEALISKPTDKFLVDPHRGSPYTQLVGKVAGEGIGLLAPFRLLKGRGGETKIDLKLRGRSPMETGTHDAHIRAFDRMVEDGVYQKGHVSAFEKSKAGDISIETMSHQDPTLVTPFRSPSSLAEIWANFKDIFFEGRESVTRIDRIREMFGNRLHKIDLMLGGDIIGTTVGYFKNNQYRQNRKAMNDILLEGDMQGKNFTVKELKDRGYSDNVISGYRQTRSAFNHAYRMARNVRDEFGRPLVEKRVGYIPHFFHNYFVRFGNNLRSAKTLGEAKEIAKQAKAEGWQNIKINPKPFKFVGEETQAVVLGDHAYHRMMREFETKWEMSEADLAQMKDYFTKSSKNRQFGNFMERKGVEGWEQNLDWAVPHYFNKVSRYIGMERFKHRAISHYEKNYKTKFTDAPEAGSQAAYARQYINDMLGVPNSMELAISAGIRKVPWLNRFSSDSLGGRPSAELASRIAGATAVAKLGLYNVSAAAVNMTQLMMSNAILAGKGSMAPVSPYLLQGIQRTLGIATRKGLRQFGVKVKPSPSEGLLRKMNVGRDQGLESGAGYSKFNAGKIFNATTSMFRGAEFLLRSSTGIGAFMKSMAETRGKGMTELARRKQAIEYAKDVNRQANFDYSIADAPSALRNPLGVTVGQFKKFPIKAVEFMWGLEGMQHARFWTPFMLMSGMNGVPGLQFFTETIKQLGGPELELEIKKEIAEWAGDDPDRKKIAETAMYGLLSQAGEGTDISKRIGMGDVIPSKPKDLLGPQLSSMISASKAIGDTDPVQAIRSVTTAPGNMLKAIFEDELYVSPHERGRAVAKINDQDRIAMALGFRPLKVAKSSDFARITKYIKDGLQDEEKEIIDDIVFLMRSGRSNRLGKSIGKASARGITSKRIMNEMVKKGMPRDMRALMNNLTKRNAPDILPVAPFFMGGKQ